MGEILAAAFGLAGLVWVGFMLAAMFAVMRLAPKGQKLRAYHQLSMWQFGQIRADLGPAAEPHLKTMRRGAYAFLGLMGVVVVVAVISIIVNASSSTPS
jgi:hypothetical protein